MASLHILTAAEQVAEHLRKELTAGVRRGEMPGVAALAKDLGVNHKTVNAALALLERDGLLASQGARRPRRVRSSAVSLASPSRRIGLLLHEPTNRHLDYIVEIRHRLLESGHAPFFAGRTLSDLGMDADKVARWVEGTPADGWLVVAAPRGVLEWFAAGPLPAFALFGLLRSVPIAGAGPDNTPAYVEAARTLIALGHRRIVLLARPQRRHPLPGHPERHFLQTLREAGIEPSDYHFPVWKDTKEDFHRCLDSLFRFTPPTALVVQEPTLFAAVQQFLAARGVRVPRDVSLVCDDPDPTFAWQIPTVAHIRWKSDPWARRVTRWADNMARGRDDRRRTLTKAQYIPGGTVGPAPERERRANS
jgi:DNA-binding LacI/PurR family transcriptional regulator